MSYFLENITDLIKFKQGIKYKVVSGEKYQYSRLKPINSNSIDGRLTNCPICIAEARNNSDYLKMSFIAFKLLKCY